MTKPILVLDAGHSLVTPGKQTMNGKYGVIKEWDLNNKVLLYVMEYLKDYAITIYRTDDSTGKTEIDLLERVKRCNAYGAILMISLHHNATPGATGVEVYWHTNGTSEDKKIASIVAPKLAASTGLRNRGVKQAKWTVLTCKATAILVEGGFMDTQSDYEYICSEVGQRAYARAVADSVIEYLNLKKLTTSTPQVDPDASTTSTGLKVGDKVKVKSLATTYANSTKQIPSYVKGSEYTVGRIDNGNVVLLNEITSLVKIGDVEKVSDASRPSIELYKVKIICDELNVRQSASFDSKVFMTVKKGEVFTVTEESNGLLKLKSGKGWISANPNYVRKI